MKLQDWKKSCNFFRYKVLRKLKNANDFSVNASSDEKTESNDYLILC